MVKQRGHSTKNVDMKGEVMKCIIITTLNRRLHLMGSDFIESCRDLVMVFFLPTLLSQGLVAARRGGTSQMQ